VKPLHLNLASRPYRDYRPLYAVIVLASLAIFVLAYANADSWLRYRTETESTRARITSLETQTEQEKHRGDQAADQLRRINIGALARQTQFVNAQLAERAFSWSELLDRLEEVIADNVRIVAVAPTFHPDGLVHLEMQCEAKTADGMVSMIGRFNRDPHFANPFPTVEQANQGGGYVFHIGVDYRPTTVKAVAQ